MNSLTDIAQKNLKQTLGAGHPYTCARCRDQFGIYFRFECDTPLAGYGEIMPVPIMELDKYRNQGYEILINDWQLVATKKSWLCPTCGYTQEFK